MEALQEEKSTLEIELANIQGECMATKSLKKSLEQRLETCTKKSEEEVTRKKVSFLCKLFWYSILNFNALLIRRL